MFNQRDTTLTKFDTNRYYQLRVDHSVDENKYNVIAQPTLEGGKLIAHYYANKYQTKIVLYSKRLAIFLNQIETLLTPHRKENGDYRVVFLVNFGGAHTYPFIYIKENQEEGLFYPDSIGLNPTELGTLHILKTLQKNSTLKVYLITDGRQRDYLSCHTDALIIARDTTARDPSTQQFRIPALLTFLKSHAKELLDDIYEVRKMPNELLKTPQKNIFVTSYQEDDAKKIIHKKETLAVFRARYSDPYVLMHKGLVKHDAPSYLRKKGLKLADTIEIQFYLQQLAALFPEANTQERRQQFITAAKKILLKYPTITSDDSDKHYELYRFTLDCLATLKKEEKAKKQPPSAPGLSL